MKQLKKRVKVVGRLTVRLPSDPKLRDAIMVAVFQFQAATGKAFGFMADHETLTIDGED